MNRGVTLSDLGRLEEALADHDVAIRLHEELARREGRHELPQRPGLARAYMNRGTTLRIRGPTGAGGGRLRRRDRSVQCTGT